MRKILSMGKIKADDDAMVGIGTLIIFIAMVLVAAIAAGILIQTAENVSSTATSAVREASEQISTGVDIIKAYGYSDYSRTYLKYVGIVIEKGPGSYDIDISTMKLAVKADSLILLSLNETSVQNVCGENVFQSINLSNLSKTTFGVVAIHDRDYSIVQSHGLNSGDKALLIIDIEEIFSGEIPRNGMEIEIIPEIGRITKQTILFPSTSIGTRVVDLYL
jgi:archaeal flagellin FlaB